MTTDFERPRSKSRNRFGQLSKSMFFARHVAQPRYLGFITGAIGQRVWHVREEPLRVPMNVLGENTTSLMTDPRFAIDFMPNSFNETLLRTYASKLHPKKRRERLLPPIPGWNPTGMVVEDTSNWRRELARIAEMVGFVTADELIEIDTRKEVAMTPPLITSSLSSFTNRPPTTTGQYSRRSGRWNETPKPVTRSRSSSSRRTPLKFTFPDHLYCVDEQEREMWMLQILCQILQTDSISEIQSWLVSSGPNEKEAVRQLITTAMKGLEDNGRISTSDDNNENTKGVQVNMDSFGSLLAARFPQVPLATSPATPMNEILSRPTTRPRTAPTIEIKLPSRTQFHSKSTGSFQTNLPQINESIEKLAFNTKRVVTEPMKTDGDHSIQILTLEDIENESKEIKNEQDGTVPF